MVLIDTLPLKIKTAFKTFTSWTRRNALFLIPGAILAIFFIGFAAIYLPSRTIEVVYSQTQHCQSAFVPLPASHYARSDQSVAMVPQHITSLAGHKLWARQICLDWQGPPQPGQHTIKLALFNQLLLAQNFTIIVPEPPQVNVSQLAQPLSVTKPLVLSMTDTDSLFDYQVEVANQTQSCQSQSSKLTCPINQLELDQGQEYQLELRKTFGQDQPDIIVAQVIQTLSATNVVNSSLTDQQTVYDRPTSMTVEFDKEVVDFTVTLINTDQPDQPISTDHTIETKLATITWPQELPRQASFQLTIDQLQAKDGSTLEDPLVINFVTSGGPQVRTISIGRAGVALASQVTIVFDQQLSSNQDISALVSLSPGRISPRISGNSISFALSGVGKCTDFVITVNKGIKSQHDLIGQQDWTYNSRTLCHTSEIIGYSVQGRPIVAYHFGSGSTTILYVGAIHGNEIGAKYLLDRWIHELETKARELPSNRQIVVVPLVNPDGFAAGTRNNANNVDLNRNWDVLDWTKDIVDTRNMPLPGGGGSKPMSEPETKALAAFTSRLKPRTTMSFHNVASVVIANQAAHSTALAQLYSQLSGYTHGTGQSSSIFNYTITGTYDDWIAEKLGLASVLVETGSRSDPQWSRNIEGLWRVARY